jgi:hypothetical protein
MIRRLYLCVVRLHPPGFRRRFDEEMVSIFDQSAGTSSALSLLGDGLLSLARQWAWRREYWHDLPAAAPQSAADGVPLFSTLDPFRPPASAIIHGLVLSTVMFSLNCFAIRYSWIGILHARMRQIQAQSSPSMAGSNSSNRSAGSNSSTSRDDASAPIPAAFGPVASGSQAAVSPIAREDSALPGAARHSPSLGKGSAELDETKPTGGLQSGNGTETSPSTNPGNAVSELASTKLAGDKLDATARHRVVAGAIANLKQHYVDPPVAQKMADVLQAHEKSGVYDAETDGTAFARLLTLDIREVSHDMHLDVIFSQDPIPQNLAGPTAEDSAQYREIMQRENCTFEKASILPHNIGYVKLNSFPDLSICRKTAAAAMATVNHADAVIFDLRDNRGGEPDTVAFIAAYLFDHPEYWYDPRENTTQKSWTASPVPESRLPHKPAYVLTSASTASGAEQFTYNLKMLKRATIVGQKTAGAAHAGVFYRIDDHFGMGIPETRAINPFSATDWAEIGVAPDVKVNPDDALETAENLAVTSLGKK